MAACETLNLKNPYVAGARNVSGGVAAVLFSKLKAGEPVLEVKFVVHDDPSISSNQEAGNAYQEPASRPQRLPGGPTRPQTQGAIGAGCSAASGCIIITFLLMSTIGLGPTNETTGSGQRRSISSKPSSNHAQIPRHHR